MAVKTTIVRTVETDYFKPLFILSRESGRMSFTLELVGAGKVSCGRTYLQELRRILDKALAEQRSELGR